MSRISDYFNNLQSQLTEIDIYYMGDQHNYHVNQAGAVGPGATVSNSSFEQQNSTASDRIDFENLISELATLKSTLIQNATSGDHFNAIAQVTYAEEATKTKDVNGTVKHLVTAGKWALDFASKIGVNVVTDIIKGHLK